MAGQNRVLLEGTIVCHDDGVALGPLHVTQSSTRPLPLVPGSPEANLWCLPLQSVALLRFLFVRLLVRFNHLMRVFALGSMPAPDEADERRVGKSVPANPLPAQPSSSSGDGRLVGLNCSMSSQSPRSGFILKVGFTVTMTTIFNSQIFKPKESPHFNLKIYYSMSRSGLERKAQTQSVAG